jgi:predicted RNA-binding Zn ribbon-like protein
MDGWKQVLPDEPVAVRFINTVWADRAGIHDALRSAADLERWLEHVRPLPEHKAYRVGHEDLVRFRTLREAMRCVAILATADDRPVAAMVTASPADSIELINRIAREGAEPPRLEYTHGTIQRIRPEPSTLPARALARIALEMIDLCAEPDTPKLGACRAPGCVLYFAKRPPRRTWCSPACGNRARVARHYRHTHSSSTGQSAS